MSDISMMKKRKRVCDVEEKDNDDKGKMVINDMSDFNDDILFNIFIKIPGEILITKFMYQCHKWFNLISNPIFVETHTHQSEDGILQIVDDSKLMFMDLKRLESDSAHQMLPDNFEVQCQCNGLILVKETCSGIFYVTNPTTKETISLPRCKHRCQEYMTEVRWDMVYVPSTKTYKVVEFTYDFVLKSSALHIQMLCASSTCSDSWRPIKNINRILSYYTRISVNGILYMETGENEPIVSFDVGDETTVRVFRFTVKNYYHSKWLIEMDGLPALIGRPCWGSAEYDVWILKNDVEWVKHFKFWVPPGMRPMPNVLGSL